VSQQKGKQREFQGRTCYANLSSMGTTRQLYGKAMEEGLVTFGASNGQLQK